MLATPPTPRFARVTCTAKQQQALEQIFAILQEQKSAQEASNLLLITMVTFIDLFVLPEHQLTSAKGVAEALVLNFERKQS